MTSEFRWPGFSVLKARLFAEVNIHVLMADRMRLKTPSFRGLKMRRVLLQQNEHPSRISGVFYAAKTFSELSSVWFGTKSSGLQWIFLMKLSDFPPQGQLRPGKLMIMSITRTGEPIMTDRCSSLHVQFLHLCLFPPAKIVPLSLIYCSLLDKCLFYFNKWQMFCQFILIINLLCYEDLMLWTQ